MHAKLLQSCPSLCNLMDGSPPDCAIFGILQARILEWVAMPSSRGSSRPISCTVGGFFKTSTTCEIGLGFLPHDLLISWSFLKAIIINFLNYSLGQIQHCSQYSMWSVCENHFTKEEQKLTSVLYKILQPQAIYPTTHSNSIRASLVRYLKNTQICLK